MDSQSVPNSAPSLTLFYLLGTGCQWRLLPREFPRPGTVYHYFRAWKDAGVLAEQQGALHELARLSRSCLPCPSVVILDSQSVKTAERGGIRGFDGHKQVKGRKRIVRIEYALCRLWAVNPGIAVVVPLIGLQDGDRSISSIVGDISPVIA